MRGFRLLRSMTRCSARGGPCRGHAVVGLLRPVEPDSRLSDVSAGESAVVFITAVNVIVRAEARSIDALGRLVVSRIQAIDGVTRTLTCSVVHL
jgi:hypothetical protein